MEFDWSRYAVQGAARPDGISGLRPEFRSGLEQFLAAADQSIGPGLQVFSGYRSPERQAELYQNALAKYGSPEAARKWVAPPGRSRHNFGDAADLTFNGVRLDKVDPAIREWVIQNAANYGLDVPMSWEPWQVELAGARGNRPAGQTAPSGGPYGPRQMPQDRRQMAQGNNALGMMTPADFGFRNQTFELPMMDLTRNAFA